MSFNPLNLSWLYSSWPCTHYLTGGIGCPTLEQRIPDSLPHINKLIGLNIIFERI